MSKEHVYPVRRGARYHRLMVNLIYSRVVSEMETRRGDTEQDDYCLENADYYMLLNDRPVLEQFCRLIAYTDHTKSDDCYLVNCDGEKMETPPPECTDHDLTAFCLHLIKVDEDTTERIDARILNLNPRLTPEHMVSASELTEEQKADPNL